MSSEPSIAPKPLKMTVLGVDVLACTLQSAKASETVKSVRHALSVNSKSIAEILASGRATISNTVPSSSYPTSG